MVGLLISELESVAEFSTVTIHLSNMGVTERIWVGGEANNVFHYWRESGVPINASLWPGGVENPNYSNNNMKYLQFSGSSPASPVCHLAIASGAHFKALCEETPCP